MDREDHRRPRHLVLSRTGLEQSATHLRPLLHRPIVTLSLGEIRPRQMRLMTIDVSMKDIIHRGSLPRVLTPQSLTGLPLRHYVKLWTA